MSRYTDSVTMFGNCWIPIGSSSNLSYGNLFATIDNQREDNVQSLTLLNGTVVECVDPPCQAYWHLAWPELIVIGIILLAASFTFCCLPKHLEEAAPGDEDRKAKKARRLKELKQVDLLVGSLSTSASRRIIMFLLIAFLCSAIVTGVSYGIEFNAGWMVTLAVICCGITFMHIVNTVLFFSHVGKKDLVMPSQVRCPAAYTSLDHCPLCIFPHAIRP